MKVIQSKSVSHKDKTSPQITHYYKLQVFIMYLLSHTHTIGWSQVLGTCVQSASFQFAVTEIYLVSLLSDFQCPRGHMMKAGDGSVAASAEHSDS